MTGMHTSAFMNSNRDVEKQKDPFDLPMPWPKGAGGDAVTAEELAKARASLLARSAFAN